MWKRRGSGESESTTVADVAGFTEPQLSSLRRVLLEFRDDIVKEVLQNLDVYLKKHQKQHVTVNPSQEISDKGALGKAHDHPESLESGESVRHAPRESVASGETWLYRHRRCHVSTRSWASPNSAVQINPNSAVQFNRERNNEQFAELSKPLSHEESDRRFSVQEAWAFTHSNSQMPVDRSSVRSSPGVDILRGRASRDAVAKRESLTEYDAMVVDAPLLVISPVQQCVMSNEFNNSIAVMVLLNSIYIGFQTDYMARRCSDHLPPAFFYADVMFCLVFLSEVSLRAYAYGSALWRSSGWKWNVLDFALVALQVADLLVGVMARVMKSKLSADTKFFGVVRVFRLFRVLRIIRLMSIFSDLRMIIVTVSDSLRSLFWTMMMVFLVMYVCGIYLTQLVTEHKIVSVDTTQKDELENFYGNLPASMLTLYQTISEGLHWAEAVAPLQDGISPWMSFVFSMYIGFSVFAMMNVITGIFVDSALVAGHDDKRKSLMHEMRELFKQADIDNSGMITKEKFLEQLGTPYFEKLLKASDLEVAEAEDLFHLLDFNQDDEITVEAFVCGCVRVTGNARAIDLLTLMQEYRFDRQWMHDEIRHIGVVLENLQASFMMRRNPTSRGSSQISRPSSRTYERLASFERSESMKL